MQDFQQFFNKLAKDVQIELTEEFDRNFERKAFFDRAWKPAIRSDIGSLMNRTGALRKSIKSTILNRTEIEFTSSEAYAAIHNDGGKIKVTQKMKRFFWYRYYIAAGHVKKTKSGAWNISNKNRKAGSEASFWQAMALKPVGSVIKIEQRQFIGEHPIVQQVIKNIAEDWLISEVQPFINNQLKNMFK